MSANDMDGYVRFSSSTRIRAPIAVVFDWFADRTRFPIRRSMMSLEQLPPGPVGLGTVFKVHSNQRSIDVLFTVDDFQRPYRVRFRIDWPGEQPMYEAYTMVLDGDRTLVRHEGGSLATSPPRFRARLGYAAMRPLYAVIGPLGLWSMRRRIEREYRSPDIQPR